MSRYSPLFALEAQGRVEEADELLAQYHRAWADADELTTTSCKCIPGP